jgi:hypothetical protein
MRMPRVEKTATPANVLAVNERQLERQTQFETGFENWSGLYSMKEEGRGRGKQFQI